MRSSRSSIPIERRTTSGPAPALILVASSSWLCVVEAGWITSERARAHVQQLRHDQDAIVTGIGTVLADEDVKKRLENVGATANLSTPAELKKTIESDIAGFRQVAKNAGLEAQ